MHWSCDSYVCKVLVGEVTYREAEAKMENEYSRDLEEVVCKHSTWRDLVTTWRTFVLAPMGLQVLLLPVS